MSTKPDLLEIIRALAVGAPVDWSRLDTPADQTTRAFLRELELVSRVAEVHGTVADDATDESAATPTPTDDQPTHPHQWGTLALMERVGKGAYGEVYRAWDARLDREVALKLLDPTGDSIEGTVIEEGKSLARVRHQNVLTVHGADRIDGRVGIWAEFIEGQTLEESLQTEGLLPPTEAVNVAIDVCRGLAAVHRAGLVHGDIKAANVMREDGARVVLMDFGASASSHTVQSRRVVGTPLYMAPEVLEGQNPTIRSDVYGVGVLLYHLLTASYPTSGTTLADVRTAHRNDDRRRLIDISPNVPAPLIAVVERAITTDPAGRFESADDMAEALARVLQTPVSIPLPLLGRIAQHWRLIAVLTLAVGLAAAVWAFTNHSSSTPARLDFAPRDYVLITRFDNRTGETVFDGAVEYALQRALSESTVIGIVPDERIEDALALMKAPPATIVDRRIGREVALRDGHIKVVLTGRIDRFGNDYVITTQLVDPANDAVVSTIAEETRGKDDVLPALRREAQSMRRELGEKLPLIRGADPDVERATTASLQAFQLYNQSYRLGRQGNWPAALEVAREVVKADPEFASGWVWLAWAVNNTELKSPLEKRIAGFGDYLERGRQLEDRVPEWERHWITGSYFTLTGQSAESIPHYQALLQLRPDHFYALNNLLSELTKLRRLEDYPVYLRAAVQMGVQRPDNPAALATAARAGVLQTGLFESAKPFIDKLDMLSRQDRLSAKVSRFYRDFATAYASWSVGDAAGALRQVNAIAAAVDSYPLELRVQMVTGLLDFYESLGRLEDKRRFAASLRFEADRRELARAEAVGAEDPQRLRKLLAGSNPLPQILTGPAYVRAGLLDQARLYVDGKLPDYSPEYGALTEGMLTLVGGQPEKAAEQLQHAMHLFGFDYGSNYWFGCESLADALSQLGRYRDAIASLEQCNADFRSLAVWLPLARAHARLELPLADLYERIGNLEAANRIRVRLRARLALADPDYPVLLELNKRK